VIVTNETEVLVKKVELRESTQTPEGADACQVRIHLSMDLDDEQAAGLENVGGAVEALLVSSREQDGEDSGPNTVQVSVKRPFGAVTLTIKLGKSKTVIPGATVANQPKVSVVEGKAAIGVQLDAVVLLKDLSKLGRYIGIDEDVLCSIKEAQKTIPFPKGVETKTEEGAEATG
jgi:hypothetical protein